MVHDFILKPIRKWLWVDPYLGTHFGTYGTSFTKFGISFIKFGTCDNEAKYEAILTELSLALTLLASKLEICSDFQLFIGQIQGEYEAKDELMARYLSKFRIGIDKLNKWVVKRILRLEKTQVNALAGITTTFLVKEAILLLVYLQVVSSVAVAPLCNTNEASVSWMNEIETYLKTEDLPKESKRAHKIRVQAAHFTLIEGSFYRWSFGDPYLRCLNDTEA